MKSQESYMSYYSTQWWVKLLAQSVECSPMVRETWVQSQVESYQRLQKWYLIPPCLTLSNIRYVSGVKWSNPGKEVAPSPTLGCSSNWKGSLLVTLDSGHRLYLFYLFKFIPVKGKEVTLAIFQIRFADSIFRANNPYNTRKKNRKKYTLILNIYRCSINTCFTILKSWWRYIKTETFKVNFPPFWITLFFCFLHTLT